VEKKCQVTGGGREFSLPATEGLPPRHDARRRTPRFPPEVAIPPGFVKTMPLRVHRLPGTPLGLLSLAGHWHRPGPQPVTAPAIPSWDFAPLQGLSFAASPPEHARSAFAAPRVCCLPARSGRPAIHRDCLPRHIRSQGFDPLSVLVPDPPAPPVKAESASGFSPSGVSPPAGPVPLSRPSPFLRLGLPRNVLELSFPPSLQGFLPCRSPFAS
jgi:hypothetical protein